MLSFLWKKMPFWPEKKEKKWADQLEKINFFVYKLNIGLLHFFDILHEVRDH